MRVIPSWQSRHDEEFHVPCGSRFPAFSDDSFPPFSQVFILLIHVVESLTHKQPFTRSI